MKPRRLPTEFRLTADLTLRSTDDLSRDHDSKSYGRTSSTTRSRPRFRPRGAALTVTSTS